MKPTIEQQTIIDHRGSACVNAVAGSGKTATLIAYAKARPSQRILYVAFNRSVKLESQQRFKDAGCHHVRVETAHSLAYAGFGVRGSYLISSKGLALNEIVQLCGLTGTASSPQHHLILANHIHQALTMFCNSDLPSFSQLDYASSLLSSGESCEFAKDNEKEITSHARWILGEMYHNHQPLVHDAYLKFYQLQKPSLSQYDTILVDEAQDISRAMLDVFLSQSCTIILVGDEHQSIYAFRHAINAMAIAPFPRFSLTNSFRFGPDIAKLASRILRMKRKIDKKCAVPQIVGAGPSTGTGSYAVLARNNLQLVKSAMDIMLAKPNKKLHFEGGLHNYTCMGEGSSLFDMLYLRIGKKDKIRNSFISNFQDYNELSDYIKATGDQEMKLASQIIEKYSLMLFDLIRKLKKAQGEKQDADIIFSTVHKAKGSEYDKVVLCEGFISEDSLTNSIRDMKKDPDTAPDPTSILEEINILYVAATRASKTLEMDFAL